MIMTKEKHCQCLSPKPKSNYLESGSPKRYAENLEAEIKRDHISFDVNQYILYSVRSKTVVVASGRDRGKGQAYVHALRARC